MPDHFFVTGAMGCIGAWVVYNLVRENTAVTVFDQASEPRRLKLLLTPDQLARVRFVSGDIADLAALERALDGGAFTHLVHLAALQVPFCKADPPLGARVNVVGTVNVFEAVRKRPHIGQVVYASSAVVYGAAGDHPAGIVLGDDAPLRPNTLYGVYKQANEGTARVYWQDESVSSVGLRPYVVYGVGRDQGLTSAATRAMFAAAIGRPYHVSHGGRFDLVYADDVARTFIAAARAPIQGAQVFNLTGSLVHMREVVAAIEAAAPELTGKITFEEQGLPFAEAMDGEPLARALGKMPLTPLAEGVAWTVRRFRELAASGQIAEEVMLGR